MNTNTKIIELLEDKSTSFLIIQEKSTEMVVGVPHHAYIGKGYLPCPEHPAADENAGFLGEYVAAKLDASSIIACNYTMDVNKRECSDYSTQIAKWEPKMLVEIHGHAGRTANFDVEISSGGTHNNEWSQRLAKDLKAGCSGVDGLHDLTISGDYDEIYFTACNSKTILSDKWIPFHIELPIRLRKTKQRVGKPPKIGYQFCDVLVDVLRKILTEINGKNTG